MSQKPKPGAQARATPAPAAPKEVSAKAARSTEQSSIKAEPFAGVEPASDVEPVASAGALTNIDPVAEVGPDAKAEPVAEVGPGIKVEPVANSEPVVMEPTVKSEPIAKAEPVVTPMPAIPAVPPANAGPVAPANAEPVAKLALETEVIASDAVTQTIAAASDLTAASESSASETIKAATATVATVTKEVVENVSSIKPTRPTITLGIKTMLKSTEDFVAFGQANLEAFVKSGQIWSAGVQELTKQFATSAKASFEESVSTFKAISTAKSVKEAMDLQSSFAKAALEKAMAESNKMTDASIKLTEQTLAPITARVTVAVESFGKTV